MQGKTMAVIGELKFGVSPQKADLICATMRVYITEESSSIMQLPQGKLYELLMAFGLQDINRVVGRTVWVNVGQDGTMVYDRPCVISLVH